MKKICLVFNSLNESNGVANAAISIANVLSANGKDVDLIAVFGTDNTYNKYLSSKVKVRTIFNFYFRGFVRLLYLLPPQILYSFFIRHKYDVEIAFQYGIATKVLAYSLNKEAKHFVWMHSYDSGLTQKKYYLKFDRLISVSRFNEKQFLRDLGRDFPTTVIYNPIDETSIVRAGSEYAVLEDKIKPTLITVGRLSSQKGYTRLLKITRDLLSSGYTFKLYIIGDGEEKEKLESLCKKYALKDSVVMLGEQSNPHKFTAKCDLFICSSLYEGYSTACMEAQMLGVPMLSTRVAGAEEIVECSECGMVVDNTDEALFNGIKTVLDNPELIDEWKNVLKQTKYRYSMEFKVASLLKLIDGNEYDEK